RRSPLGIGCGAPTFTGDAADRRDLIPRPGPYRTSSRGRILAAMPVATPPLPVRAVTTETIDVSVVIVNYNVREFLEQALGSVDRASAGLVVETFVVDNNSVDGSVAMVRERFPHVRVIANE